MIGGLAHSGRVIFAAGAVMVAVFFTFALSGPLPPKEMGIILGVAVLLDAVLVRLLLLPVLLRLMGRWAWYLPRWAHRVLPAVSFGARLSPGKVLGRPPGRCRHATDTTIPPREVDPQELERHIAEMYRDVANEAGRPALPDRPAARRGARLPAELLDRLPARP